MLVRKYIKKSILLSSLLLVIAAANGCAKVDAGAGGVMWTAWGGTQDDLYREGWYFVAPWNKLFTYNVRIQDRAEVLDVLANNGLSIKLETSVRYMANLNTLPLLHKTVGPSYYDILIAPSIRSAARKVVGRYTPEQIYSTKREEVEQETLIAVTDNLKNALSEKIKDIKNNNDPSLIRDPIVIKAILVRNVDLPDKLKRAINDKLQEEQRALKMKFTLNRERQEATRKGIEAKGIAEKNNIITASINDKLLRYEGIQATDRLSNSTNAKVVIIGSGKDGLPIILGNAN